LRYYGSFSLPQISLSGCAKKVNRTTILDTFMNETKIVIFGLIALVTATILLWILDEPEILVEKEIEVVIALGVGILILILDIRAGSRVHEMMHEQHVLIGEMHKQINEQNEIIKNMQKMSSTYEGHTNNKDSK
jgi:ABC-type glucose/galactose transport system permease subunit